MALILRKRLLDDHGDLGGLGDDDHTIYALLAGRSGGQELIGGSDSGDDLTLQSTSNATKGSIIFGSTTGMVFDEVNTRVSIGIAPGDSTLHVHTAAAGSGITATATADDLVVEGSGDSGITILAPNAARSSLVFGSPSDNLGARIDWVHDSDIMDISTFNTGAELTFSTSNGAEAMRIDSNQNVGINTTSFGTNLANGLAFGNGTAASAVLANGVMLWAADFAADDSRLYLMSEAQTNTLALSGAELAFSTLGKISGTTITVDNNGADTVAILGLENTGGDFQIFRDDASPESVITGSIGDLCIDGTGGGLYLKISGGATNTGWEQIGGTPSFKSYSLSNPGTADTFYIGGHYAFAATDATLTIGGTVIQTFGSAGEAHGSHAFCVASGAGGTDLVLTVTGVSITDAGARNDSDTEIIVADTDAAITDQYFETSKKWLGQITYTLTGSSGAFTFNYGFVKYEDFGNRSFTVTDFDMTGEARANETGLNIELLHHESTAFVYDASAFVPNQTALVSLATDYSTNNDVASGDAFAYKRSGLTTAIAGDSGEGLIIRITTVVNNSINDATAHIGVTLN